MLKTVQLNVYNVEKLRRQMPQEFEAVRLDSNNDCNVHCVYCHNHRSKDLIETDEIRGFLEENVISVNNFQIGCGMEPTLDLRMCDLMLMIAQSRARPKHTFCLQTNGILLHKHDFCKIKEARLDMLSVSIDSVDATTHKALRGGTSLRKVLSNLLRFRDFCPEAKVVFITTVTNLNVDGMDDLVLFGLDIGVTEFTMRQMFYFPNSNMVDHSRMPALQITEETFRTMEERLSAKFGDRTRLCFLGAPKLLDMARQTRADSMF